MPQKKFEIEKDLEARNSYIINEWDYDNGPYAPTKAVVAECRTEYYAEMLCSLLNNLPKILDKL